ncbi:claudin-4-like [Corythoichthys intestinalis]|uniref:claudin-4-like n=1 Tax=Corythoichthys intestinalis TaxID=161448 RepID=UPI0025A66488|nr:claudin-4-like [Corythoichthys intestinalis]XP_057676583.1 claudin-4-like [Corythoichthys intestinalis]XP_061801568.1 claudin-4-like [Nerophis lumbriciformis]
MVFVVMEIIGFFLGLVGILASLICTVLPFWEVSADIDTLKSFGKMRGLWMECTPKVNGVFACKPYDAILHLAIYVQVSRALMVISLALSTLGLAFAVFGMKCTICLKGPGALKRNLAGVAGCFFLAAGLMTLVPVSWTAKNVISAFHVHDTPAAAKLELGDCIYLGIFAALASIMGGSLLVVSFCKCRDCGGRDDCSPYRLTYYPRAAGDIVVPLVQHPPVLQMGRCGVIDGAQTLTQSCSESDKGVKPMGSAYV